MNQVADRIDLAIDLITLGQYGLEQIDPPRGPSPGPCAGGRTRRRPLRPTAPLLLSSRLIPGGSAPSRRGPRRRGPAHNEYEWGWPARDADGGPSSASSLWAMAHS